MTSYVTNNNIKLLRKDCLQAINNDFNNERIYGLEYILDDLFKDECLNAVEKPTMDWYGLSDLTIE